MPEVTDPAHGSFCWIELATTDEAVAKQFYLPLFGWTNSDDPIPGDGVYVTLKKNDKAVGAMYEKKDLPHPSWLSYVSVANVDESAEKAKSLGGTLLAPPFDVMDAGRMAMVQDPSGAVFALWQAGKNKGLALYGEPGTLCWNELTTRDTAGAERFYTGLFGWTTKHSPEYTEFHLGDRGIGGMFPMPPEMEGVPPFWMPYFAVEDCDATAAKATASGGRIMVGPKDIPDVGRFAVASDPAGAAFAIIKLGRGGVE